MPKTKRKRKIKGIRTGRLRIADHWSTGIKNTALSAEIALEGWFLNILNINGKL